MTIIGPNNEVLAKNGKLMFKDVTCADCRHCIERSGPSGKCRPKLPPWAIMASESMFTALEHRPGECECFEQIEAAS